jgi:basic amino acid/polyamine antiporter, APA family
MGDPPKETQPIKAQLGLWDAVSIIIGIVIGASIYETPPRIFGFAGGPWAGLGVWALGGALSFIGALCYAELASAYPRSGGDYVYLKRAFGPWCGFLFGWSQLAAVLAANTGMMAFVFADYAGGLLQIENSSTRAWLAVAAVSVLSALNLLGSIAGKWTQNILSIVKIVGLLAIAGAGFLAAHPQAFAIGTPPKFTSIGLAMIFVLFAYGGWNDAAFVAADVRDRRNIVRCLLLGTGIITVIYLAVNLAYLLALGYDGVRSAEGGVAAAVLQTRMGDNAGKAMSVLVMISALGAVNGLIFTGSRVYSTLGAENRIFSMLGHWNPRFGSPSGALFAQWAICLLMILAVGTETGRETINTMVQSVGMDPIPWEKKFENKGFDALLAMTAPVFWTFFLLTGLSLFALRERDPDVERPFRVPLFPLVPLIFCGTCIFMLYSAIDYAGKLILFGLLPVLLGLPLYYLSTRTGPAGPDTSEAPAMGASDQ